MPLVCCLNDTIYQRDVYLFVGPRKEFREYLLNKWGKSAAGKIPKRAQGAVFAITAPTKYPRVRTLIYFVWLISWSGEPSDYGCLAHECYHAVMSVLDELGVTPSEEAIAYYLDSMVTQFSQSLASTITCEATSGL
jgi:hypothetical protein